MSDRINYKNNLSHGGTFRTVLCGKKKKDKHRPMGYAIDKVIPIKSLWDYKSQNYFRDISHNVDQSGLSCLSETEKKNKITQFLRWIKQVLL